MGFKREYHFLGSEYTENPAKGFASFSGSRYANSAICILRNFYYNSLNDVNKPGAEIII